jgi:hypothetical protein
MQVDTAQADTATSVPGALIPPVPAIVAIVVAFLLLAVVVVRARRRR